MSALCGENDECNESTAGYGLVDNAEMAWTSKLCPCPSVSFSGSYVRPSVHVRALHVNCKSVGLCYFVLKSVFLAFWNPKSVNSLWNVRGFLRVL